MGKQCSKLKPTVLRDLKNNTKFSGKEIRDWYKIFSKDCPSGHMPKEQFKALFLNYFPCGDADEFAEYVFRTFDTNGDGTIDFREMMCSLSVTARGQPEEKLEWLFSMCDLDGNGYISQQEMLMIISVLYKSMEPGTDIDDTPETLTQKIFQFLDGNEDGRISFEEFMEATKYPEIRNLLVNEFESQ